MPSKLCIYVCNSLVPEVKYVLKELDFEKVTLKSYPEFCVGNKLSDEYISELVKDDYEEFSKIIFFVSSCRAKKNRISELPKKIEVIQLEHCFEMILNTASVYHFSKKGYYITTPGWIKNYPRHKRSWGFTDESARKFFNESVKKILFLDTLISDNYKTNLDSLSEYTGLKYEVFPVGTDYLKKYIQTIIKEWKSEEERKILLTKISELTRTSADFSTISNELKDLVNFTDENIIVEKISFLVNVLFIPENVFYYKYVEEKEISRSSLKETDFTPEFDNSNSIKIDVKFQGKLLGKFIIYKVRFVQYLPYYLEMCDLISQIAGLSIENARKYHELNLKNNELESANSEKDKFFSIISHDLRGPFSNAVNILELMTDSSYNFTKEQLDNYTQSLYKTAKSTYTLLENLLLWSRIQLGVVKIDLNQINIKEFIGGCDELTKEAANNKSIKLIINIPDYLIVIADETMLHFILRNLVGNSIKFTNPGGSIIVSARKNEDGKIEFSVSDNGIGMNEGILRDMFRLNKNIGRMGTNKEPSSGLGLLLCKEFVEKQNGKIWVKSEEGIGSTFYFTLENT